MDDGDRYAGVPPRHVTWGARLTRTDVQTTYGDFVETARGFMDSVMAVGWFGSVGRGLCGRGGYESAVWFGWLVGVM